MMSGPIKHVDRQALGRGEQLVQSAVRMTQEKSCAVLRMPERPVRNSVFGILRAMLSNRLESTAIRTPSLTAGPWAPAGLASVPISFIGASAPLGCRRSLPAAHGSL